MVASAGGMRHVDLKPRSLIRYIIMLAACGFGRRLSEPYSNPRTDLTIKSDFVDVRGLQKKSARTVPGCRLFGVASLCLGNSLAKIAAAGKWHCL